MGTGKTESAITWMNEDTDGKYIFITPYKKEIDRIKASCQERHFFSPENIGQGKLDNLHSLLGRGCNIASTHALFSTYTPYTAELIHNGDYTLVLDEVFCVVEPVEMKPSDYKILEDSGMIELEEDGEHVRWLDDAYDGTKFQDIMYKAKAHTLIFYKGQLLFWTFPFEIFKAFKEVIILTYLFDAQMQKYYFEMNGVKTEKIGVRYIDGRYRFAETTDIPDRVRNIKNLVHIIDDEKLNRIGDYEYALSSSWYQKEKKKKNKPLITVLKNNLYNFFRNKYCVPVDKTLWTTFKECKGALSGKGYTSGFISCNLRATNEWRERTHLAYCINNYFNPLFKQYFISHGAKVDEDGYALSEMIQWIWRSAVRDGKEVWVYIPSSRMRELLVEWIDKISNL